MNKAVNAEMTHPPLSCGLPWVLCKRWVCVLGHAASWPCLLSYPVYIHRLRFQSCTVLGGSLLSTPFVRFHSITLINSMLIKWLCNVQRLRTQVYGHILYCLGKCSKGEILLKALLKSRTANNGKAGLNWCYYKERIYKESIITS